MKLLGIDYGKKRLGLAVCGELKVASPAGTLTQGNVEGIISSLLEIIEEKEITGVVIGLPKNMNDTSGEMVEEVENFAKVVQEETKLPVFLWDERLSSQQADRIMVSAGLSRTKRKKNRDQIAATLILQSYADSLSHI